MTSEQGFTEF